MVRVLDIIILISLSACISFKSNDEVDWREKSPQCIQPIRGSPSSNIPSAAMAEVTSWRRCIVTQENIQFSSADIDNCFSGDKRWDYLQNIGIVTESCFPDDTPDCIDLVLMVLNGQNIK